MAGGTFVSTASCSGMKPKFLDHLIVDLDTPEEAKLWQDELGVSLPALRVAMYRVGPRLNDIREELGMARIYIFPRDHVVMERFITNGLLQRQ